MPSVLEYERIEDEAAPWWRSALLVVPVWFFVLTSAVFSPAGWSMQHGGNDVLSALRAVAAMLLSIGIPVALFWRHRYPFEFTIAAAVAPLLIPIGNLPALVMLASLIGRRRGPAVQAVTALVAVTTTIVVVLDAFAQPRGASVANFVLTSSGPPEQSVHAAWWLVALLAVLLLGGSIGGGMIARLRRLARRDSQVVQLQRETVGRLGDEVARRQERERIAREVHDAMGHRLSLLNLHAGALEMNAGEDARLQESAHLVRRSAGEAMDDLRSLLQVLREPLGTEPVAIPLSRLPEVVQDSFGAGQTVNSSIYISDAERADPTLSRAVYRTVQEVLTNARKHAPGVPVVLSVQGSPASGIVIDARNRYVRGAGASAPGSSRGLQGITERAELLGGTVKYGLDEGGTVFRVTVALPWREASAG